MYKLAFLLFFIAANVSLTAAQCPLCDLWVAVHNNVRANGPFGPGNPAPNPPLTPLTWSNSAQAVAVGWAATCTYAHNPNRGALGENIYWQTGSAPGPANPTNFWAAENQLYNWTTNTCLPLQECGHYTQIVWSTTTQVGCAIQSCDGTFGTPPPGVIGPWHYVVCDYSPPGNIVGVKPYNVTTAAAVSLSGRVVAFDGRGITNALVKISGGGLAAPQLAVTGRSGGYRFDDLESGQTYVLSVQARRFTFADPSRVITLNDNVVNANFVSDPPEGVRRK